eukprot:m.159943 g.159943  ORF g.159943 m.159943 type:complete len:383 (-) comp17614_c0_seq1:195-1343(-)
MGSSLSSEMEDIKAGDVGKTVNEFTFKLLPLVADGQDTIFVSPFAVMAALGMVASGATEDSSAAQELETLLGIPFSHPKSAKVFATARDTLEHADSTVQLLLANAMFSSKTIKPEYIATIKETFHANAAPLEGVGPINAWVAKATENHIPSLFESLKANTESVLVNAIYFKADWSEKFDREKTVPGKFKVPSGEEVDCNMMCRTGSTFYSSDDATYDMVLLPYGEGKRFSACAVLPRSTEAGALDALVAGLSQDKLAAWLGAASSEAVDLQLPKFKFEYGPKDLSAALQKLGVSDSFSKPGGFLKMSDDPDVMLDQVIHKTVIEVNEEGTVAAAVGAAVMLSRELLLDTKELKFNRPFFFGILDSSSGMLVFAGKFSNPTFL